MNKTILIGRLTRDPEVKYTQSRNGNLAIGRFTIAVDRRFSRNTNDGNEPTADFFSCTCFGKQGEFVEKYLKQGTKVVVTGRLQNDNYTNKNGEKVYSVQVIVEEIEFAESKKTQESGRGDYTPSYATPQAGPGEFVAIPEGIENDLPFR